LTFFFAAANESGAGCLTSGAGCACIYRSETKLETTMKRNHLLQKIASGYLLAVFSGGKSEDDVAVAQAGLAKLAKELGAEAASK
jgi:hypothetical protein